MKVVVRTVLIAAALPALLAGCATNQVHKGTVIDRRLVGAIQPGVDNKDSVEKLLGRPSFDGAFTSNDWYYVSRDTNQLGFANPRVRKTTVLHVTFDAKGNVTSVNETGRELVMNVNPTKRNTPTLGRQKSFFEELFGNIGSVGSGGIGGSGTKP
ncbi:outer membrane protein assembly factor BamE [Sphingomonas limnosediminicola]|jgi:outer membrane protein assembly factor BamE (lipoprotein component of BamABCDE complex)